MAKKQTAATARTHLVKLISDSSQSLVIGGVLFVLGAMIAWYSFQKISLLTRAPVRYEMYAEVVTTGCADEELILFGNIGSSGFSYFDFRFADGTTVDVFGDGCRVRSVELQSNMPLLPVTLRETEMSMLVEGLHIKGTESFSGWTIDDLSRERQFESVAALASGDELIATNAEMAGQLGVDFRRSLRIGEQTESRDGAGYSYYVSFSSEWQPSETSITFTPIESINTYFQVFARQRESGNPERAARRGEWSPLDISVSFRTDDVSVIRGMVTDAGQAKGVNGLIQFGVENSDAESRRESGNVTFSAILGIGIALMTEAFVIFLIATIGVFSRNTKSGQR